MVFSALGIRSYRGRGMGIWYLSGSVGIFWKRVFCAGIFETGSSRTGTWHIVSTAADSGIYTVVCMEPVSDDSEKQTDPQPEKDGDCRNGSRCLPEALSCSIGDSVIGDFDGKLHKFLYGTTDFANILLKFYESYVKYLLYLVERKCKKQDIVKKGRTENSAFFPICKRKENDYT